MAVREYIGARYVPRFLGTFDASHEYEVLDVVDNGLGTTYILKKPAPVGTPVTDSDYWALYGASSGAIINLQNQIGSLASLTTTDKDNLVDAINEVNGDISSALKKSKFFVFPEDYGAAGDGVTNDYTALNDAFTEAATNNKTLVLSGKYFIDTSSIVSEALDIEGNGTIIYDGSGAAVTIGNNVGTDKHITINVMSSNPVSPISNSIGLLLKNMSASTIHINVNGFDKGVVCNGDSAGFQNNTILIDYIYNTDTGLILRPENNGWVNSNTFIGGKIGRSSSFPVVDGIGIYMNDLGIRYCNNNIFINQNKDYVNNGTATHSIVE